MSTNNRQFNKVFCLGLPKTGTTTLGVCLEHLGYSKAPYNMKLIQAVADGHLSEIQSEIDHYDCFEDWPWPFLKTDLINRYPDEAFILSTRRDEHAWLASLQKHTKRNPSEKSKELRKAFFGSTDPWNESERYLDLYRNHQHQIRKLSHKLGVSLLEVCWENGDGWKEICDFLGHDVPDIEFPHANSAKSRETFFRKLFKLTKKIRSKIRQ